MGSIKKTSSMFRIAFKILTVILTFILITSGSYGTAFAQTTGTADGTYDFGGCGVDDSAGPGYMAVGDKFKVVNGSYAYPGPGTAIIQCDGSNRMTFYAEGGNVCKTFTFQDMGFSVYQDGTAFKSVRLIFRDGYGNVIKQEDYGESITDIPVNSIAQLSSLTGHGVWNIKSVASVEVSYSLKLSVNTDALKFENITIANVSTTVNNPPEAHNVGISSTYKVVMGDTLTGSYDYYDKESDPEGTTTFQWYRSDDRNGKNRSPIATATQKTYVIQQDDLGKWLSFEVTPAAQSGEAIGYPAESDKRFITAPTITVSFDAQGGNAASAQVKRFGRTYGTNGTNGSEQLLPVSSYTGFVFEGWFIHANGTSYPVTDSTIVSTVSDITLYAHWTYEFYSVSYNGNGADGGSLPTDAAQYIYHDPAMVKYMSASPVTRTGCTFTGWNTKADGSGSSLKAGDIFFVLGNTTLYAQWSVNSYTVTLDAQGGTVSPDKIVKQYYSDWGSLPSLPYYPGPKKTGYWFTGWYTEPGGTGDRITNMDTMMFPYDVTLYAGWQVKEPRIILYPQSVQYDTYIYYKRWGSTYGKAGDGVTNEPLPELAQKGYKFLGWYTWDGQHITDNTVVTVEDDQELIAHWKDKNSSTGDNSGGLGAQSKTSKPGTGNEEVSKGNINPLADEVLSNLEYGYGAGTQQTKTITLTRTGGGDIKNISVSIGGADAGRFEVTKPLKSTLNSADSHTTFTIRAQDGLPVGAYSATVTVSADNMANMTFKVSQSVASPGTAAKKVDVVVYDGTSPVPDAAVTINGNERTTGASGSVMFELADGTYVYDIKRSGYMDSRGDLTIAESTDAVCLLLQKQGQTILSENGEGLVIVSDGGALPDGAALRVSALTPGNGDTAAVQVLDENNCIIAMFDINLLSGNENIEPGGPVKVGIPVPQGFDGQTLKIARINDDSTAVMCDAVVIGNMLFFSTDHLSRYAVISANGKPANSNTAEASPKAGGVFKIILWTLLGVAVIAGGVLLARLAIFKRKS